MLRKELDLLREENNILKDKNEDLVNSKSSLKNQLDIKKYEYRDLENKFNEVKTLLLLI